MEGTPLKVDGHSSTDTNLQQQLVRLPRGAHVCMLYRTSAEQAHAVVPFLREGIRRHEQSLYLADAPRTADLLDALESAGVDVQALINDRSLLTETSRDTYLRNSQFDPDAMIAFFLAKAEQTRRGGRAELRAVGEMSWALGPNTGCEQLVSYEARLNEITAATGMRILCVYDLSRFEPELVHDILRTHPVAVVGEHVHDNPYFEPADFVVGGPDVEAHRVEWMLEQMQKRSSRATAAAELGSWALQHVGQAELMEAAANIISTELGVRFVEVFELDNPDSAPRRVASVGFGDAARTEVHEIPVWDRESSFAVSIRRGDGEPAAGIVRVHSDVARIFSDDEVAFAQTVANGLAQAMVQARTEDLFETLIDNGPDLIARFDRDLRYVYGNLSFEQVTGEPSCNLIGRTSRELHLPEAVADALEPVLRQAWRSRREQVTEFALPTPLGERYFQSRIVPEFGPDGSVQSVLSIARDVTARHTAEAERAELYREVVAQQAGLREVVSRLEQAREHEQQRSTLAIQAEHLTARQRDVLPLLARGWSNREIAAELRLSPGTVKNHVSRILATLDASDRTQAAVRAVVLGMTAAD